MGARYCGWETENATLALVLYSGLEEEADIYFNNWNEPYSQEVDGIGDRARWLKDFEGPWERLSVRIAHHYVSVRIVKHEPDSLVKVDMEGAILSMMFRILDRLLPRAPVEFTQAIQTLQDHYEFTHHLESFGEPSVPIIAGKPAVIRVYYENVEEFEVRTVELSDVASAEATMHAIPGCTVEEQRKEEGGCETANLYFTPPQGEWTAHITIRDANGGQIDEMEFTIPSRNADPVEIRAVDVCHDDPGGSAPWICQSSLSLVHLVNHFRAVAPTHKVTVVPSGEQIKREVSDYTDITYNDGSVETAAQQWMSDVVQDIDDLHGVADVIVGAFTGAETYYFGFSDPTVGGYNGIASDIPGRGAMSRAVTRAFGTITTDTTIAHEIGHMLGLSHTGSASPGGAAPPACWGAGGGGRDWPYPDNKLYSGPGTVEVGFDVALQKAIPGDTTFEMMSYCAPRWISAHRYREMLAPTGPLSAGGAVPSSVVPQSTGGAYWLVSGAIEETGVDFRPLFEFTGPGTPQAEPGSLTVRVEDTGGGTLYTRAFAPVPVEPELAPGQDFTEGPPRFSEMVPAQQGAARIVILEGVSERGALELAGAPPTVTIDAALGPASAGDTVQVSWSVDDPDSAEHTFWVDYSPDGGETWLNHGMRLTDNSIALPADILPGSDVAIVRVLASDGVNTGVAVSQPFSVPGGLPQAEIFSPEDTATFAPGELVWLQGLAYDPDDPELESTSVAWSSSRDGVLGSGADLPLYDLSPGSHTITLTVTDSDDNTALDSITVIVGHASGEELIWGDNNCSGSADPVDGLLALRFDAGLSASTSDCPEIGDLVEAGGLSRAWGDVDCDGLVNPVDALKLLRFDAGLSVQQAQGCPPIGQLLRLAGGSENDGVRGWSKNE